MKTPDELPPRPSLYALNEEVYRQLSMIADGMSVDEATLISRSPDGKLVFELDLGSDF